MLEFSYFRAFLGVLTTFNYLSFLTLSGLAIAGYEFSNFESSFFAVTLGLGLSIAGVIMSSLASIWRQDWLFVAVFGAVPFALTAVYNLLAYP